MRLFFPPLGGWWRVATVVLGASLCFARPAAAQANLQLWGNITLNWVKSDRLTYELDFEPKVLVNGPDDDPGWWGVDVTPNVEYAATGWLDLVAETVVGRTKQTDDVDSIEVTPRAGVRFHVFSRDRRVLVHPRERAPRRRIVVRDLVRVESRNFFYSDDTENSSTVRFRNRLEFLAPLNKERLTEDGARYLLADWEWYIPIGEPAERFANKQRIRTGFGYRRNFHWRFELLYIWTRSRGSAGTDFETDDNSINVRLKRIY